MASAFTIDSTDWTPWEGGPCPVAPETKVDVKFEDGTAELDARADFWIKTPDNDFWSGQAKNPRNNIIRYRVRSEQ